MKDLKTHIDIKCLFCRTPLLGELDKDYQSGDLITCQECGEKNDYDSLINVTMEEAKEYAAKAIMDRLFK